MRLELEQTEILVHVLGPHRRPKIYDVVVHVLGPLCGLVFRPHNGSTHCGWNPFGGQILGPPRRPKIATMLSWMCNAVQ